MTALLLYEAILIELRKENAPNILLEDFNYFANKAISQYINKRYNIYDINLQTTDDLRVLKATTLLTPHKYGEKNEKSEPINQYGDIMNDFEHMGLSATYYVDLPSDYLHMLNCFCIYEVNRTYKCYNKGDHWRAAAKRLTADAFSLVLDNFWNRPTYKHPYYYIHNVNLYEINPTNPYNEETDEGTDISLVEERKYTVTEKVPITGEVDKYEEKSYSEKTDYRSENNLIPEDWSGIDTIKLRIGKEETGDYTTVQKAAGIRYGNASKVRCEIRYGSDDTIFKLSKIYIDYIKAPQNIRLTQTQLDTTADTSQVLEFPDYVCQEIVNELVHIIMENISDMRLQTHPVVSLSIANPAQQLTEPVALQQPT